MTSEAAGSRAGSPVEPALPVADHSFVHPPALVELDAISKSFGGVRALRGVHFDLQRGEVHALLGQNGAGKSTLIKILAGVIAKDHGSVRIDGKDVEFKTPSGSRAAGIAVVYQELSLIPSMTVADNMFLMREPSRLGIADRRRIVSEAGEFLEAHRFPLNPRKRVGDLPYAYRQLTEIATALMGNVRILVLDEPTSSLSGGEETTLFEAIAEVTKRGVGVIYVTHRLGEVFRISQRVTVFRDGLNVATHRTMDTDIDTLVAEIVGSVGQGGAGMGTIAGLGPHGEQPSRQEEVRLTDDDIDRARARNFRIGISLHTDSEWSRQQVAGITEGLRHCGAEVVTTLDAGFDRSVQVQQLAELIESSPDAIVGIPVDQAATEDAFRAIAPAGIELILMDNAPVAMTAGIDYRCVVSADNYGLGQIAARQLSDYVTRDSSVAVIELDRPFFATDQRSAAFTRWMEDERPDVTIVRAAFDKPVEAGGIVAHLLESNPDISGAFVVWDEPAMAVVKALRDRAVTIPITTVDLGTEAAIELAVGDVVKGVAAQRPFDQGVTEAEVAVLALLDRPVPPWVVLPGVAVTQANVIEAYETVWRMPAPAELMDARRNAQAVMGRAPETTISVPGTTVPVIELRGVHNDRLKGVDLIVGSGQVIGLAGMVGSGRSEILETIFGLRPVKQGELLLDGLPVRINGPSDAIRRGMALVPEDRHVQGLVLEHSIERNVAMPHLRRLERLGIFRRSSSLSRAFAVMADLSIKAPHPKTPVRSLSGGNQQKVVFGKWRDPRPVILLLDEPTVGVDIGARDQIYEVIHAAAREGTAVLIVSSELQELVRLCDGIGVVVDGQVRTMVTRSEVPNEEKLHRLVQEAQAHDHG